MGFDVHDLRPLGEGGQREFAQVPAVAHTDMDEEVVGAGHVIEREHFGQVAQMRVETLDQPARMLLQPHGDERLQADAHRLRRDLGVEAEQGLGLAQAADPFQRRGGRNAHPFGEILVRQPSVLPQQAEQIEVDSVERHVGRPLRNIVRKTKTGSHSIPEYRHSTEQMEPAMAANRNARFDTLAVHAGREDFGDLGVHAPPIDLSSTYPVPDLGVGTASFDALVGGEATAANPIYARLYNPTVARVERALARLEGTEACVAYGSGMAALTALLLASRAHGAHVLVVRPLYGTSDHLLASGLTGLEAEFVEAHEIAARVRADTALVLVETPANPTLDLVDLRAVVEAAGDVPVAVDSTFATPVLQRPFEFGARYVLHSATKFLGGHGDVVAGVICCAEADAKALRQVRAATGGLLHPLAAFLLHRGLPTLALRVERAQANAIELAHRLAAHPAVAKVFFPGLGTVRNAQLLGTQMRGPGTLIAFELRGGHAAAATVMRQVALVTPAVSLGSVDTLIQHPAGLTHRVLDDATRTRCGITPGLLRLSVGIEAVDDLWADLAQALAHDSIAVRKVA